MLFCLTARETVQTCAANIAVPEQGDAMIAIDRKDRLLRGFPFTHTAGNATRATMRCVLPEGFTRGEPGMKNVIIGQVFVLLSVPRESSERRVFVSFQSGVSTL